jgi:hypothetical protein
MKVKFLCFDINGSGLCGSYSDEDDCCLREDDCPSKVKYSEENKNRLYSERQQEWENQRNMTDFDTQFDNG